MPVSSRSEYSSSSTPSLFHIWGLRFALGRCVESKFSLDFMTLVLLFLCLVYVMVMLSLSGTAGVQVAALLAATAIGTVKDSVFYSYADSCVSLPIILATGTNECEWGKCSISVKETRYYHAGAFSRLFCGERSYLSCTGFKRFCGSISRGIRAMIPG